MATSQAMRTEFKPYERDTPLLYNTYIAIRLDIRNVGRLTDSLVDTQLHNVLCNTCKHIMNTGFKILLGYCMDDEISVVINPQDTTCSRMSRKVVAYMVSEASSYMTLQYSQAVCFDIDMYELPTQELVCTYISNRQADCYNKIIDRHCFAQLKQESTSTEHAYSRFIKLNSDTKERIASESTTFIDVPEWHKTGTLLYKEKYFKYTRDNEPFKAPRYKIVDTCLPEQSLTETIAKVLQNG